MINKNNEILMPNWKDKQTPVNAANLNIMCGGINQNGSDIELLSQAMTLLNNNKFDKVVLEGNNLKFYAKEIELFSITLPTGSGGSGVPGQDGREIELRKSSTHIEWRYVGESNWTQLVSLNELKGNDGVTPNITIGNVETLSPGSQATVTRRGTTEAPIFDFGIPQGQPGGGEGGPVDLSAYQTKRDENLTTTEKEIVAAINEVASDTSQKFDKVTLEGSELKFYAKEVEKFSITLPSGADLSNISLEIEGQILKIKNNNMVLSSVTIPTANVTDEQLKAIIQTMIDDGVLSNLLIEDSSITPQKVSWLKVVYHNIFDESTKIDGEFFYSASNADTSKNEKYFISDFIPVEPNKKYYVVNSSTRLVWFDGIKEFISSETAINKKIVTAPINSKFMKINGLVSALETTQVHEYLDRVFEYDGYKNEHELMFVSEPYSKAVMDMVINKFSNEFDVTDCIKDDSIRYNKLDIMDEFHWNVCDSIAIGQIKRDDGVTITPPSPPNNAYYTPNYIKVTPGETLITTISYCYCYDENKVFLRMIDRVGEYKVVLGQDVHYVRFYSGLTSNTMTELYAYREGFNRKFKATDNISNKEYIPTFKSDDIKKYYQNYLLDIVRPLYGKSVLHMGDSFSAVTGFSDIACEELGAKLTKKAVGGATISTHNASQNIVSYVNSLTGDENFEYITIMGGTNDASNNVAIGTLVESVNVEDFDTSTYTGALQYVINKLFTLYPYARVGIMFNATAGITNKERAKDYIEAMQKVCAWYGVLYFDMIDSVGYSYHVTKQADLFCENSNGGHPTGEGQKIIKRRYVKLLESL